MRRVQPIPASVALWSIVLSGILIGQAAGAPAEVPKGPHAIDPNCTWMLQAKYGLFMHYQYRILLGTSIRTKPQFPKDSEMTAAGWNRFVDGFDVPGFARQMSE